MMRNEYITNPYIKGRVVLKERKKNKFQNRKSVEKENLMKNDFFFVKKAS